jgi:hypothetical protein
MPELKFSKATAWRLEKTAVWLCHAAAGCKSGDGFWLT